MLSSPLPSPFPAVQAARQLRSDRRLPFLIGGRQVGSVAREHLPLLSDCAPWLQIGANGVRMDDRLRNEVQRSAALCAANQSLRDDGVLTGWRDETYAVVAELGSPVLALIERAAARFWGTLTLGAHLNGYVADGSGRPTHLWIARRALSKTTDPGKLDNLVGAGVPHGQTPFEALVRECWEESGLPAELARMATPGERLRLHRDVPAGVQHEVLHVWDLQLPADFRPRRIDGEVMEHRLLPVAEVVELLHGEEMTVDAAIATLGFLSRRGLLPRGLTDWAEVEVEAVAA
ncbi:DUF4743 domain-containing protein [Aquabacterium sp. A7-Y]|uniref:NUDIX hydrolase n=1 Tax=Aquabacterium sp. A7-Y TaxID=1349605 RepID=UPI00223DBDCF|nr:DUF4743 domain-containing protein [Aquabacterium sp. A7-Y]MCW7539522.1 DUF4743 domain-containing protein [Aquabacterium sp. A7-Y]